MGAVGVTPAFDASKLKELVDSGIIADAMNPSADKCLMATTLVRDGFLAALMLSGANKERYSALKTELSNQYGFGNDLYPKSISVPDIGHSI